MSFTLDRYGHLYPKSDSAFRDRLDALYSAASATKTPPWWTYFRSMHGPSATALTLRWGLLLSEP